MALGVNTQIKNSGILRYAFVGVGNTLDAGAPPFFVNVLADDAMVTPDFDDHVFGPSVGFVAPAGTAVMPTPGSLFDLFRGPIFGNINTQTPARRPSSNRQPKQVPRGTKLYAWFQPTSVVDPTVPPIIVVQTEVRQIAAQGRSANNDRLVGGGIYWAAIAVQNQSLGPSVVEGVLFARFQHSYVELPGNVELVGPNEAAQDQGFASGPF